MTETIDLFADYSPRPNGAPFNKGSDTSREAAGAAHKRQRVWIVGRLAESEQGRPAGQSRQSGLLGDNADVQPERSRAVNGQVAQLPGAAGLSADGDGEPLRLAELPGRTVEEASVIADDRARLGPVGAASLGCSIRAYDGVPSGDAERARHAYGDAILPIIARTIGRAILAAAPNPLTQGERDAA